MPDPRAFISFDFDHDEAQKILFAGQNKLSKSPFSVQDWSSKAALPQQQWEEKIAEKINNCNMVIVLVGKAMATATGVTKEIRMAMEANVPVFGVYVDGAATASNLPDGLPRSRVVSWDWNKIAASIDLAMKEGKNR